jgi:peptidoglycan hydrolase-like protein with peptidoglycan-binding domain
VAFGVTALFAVCALNGQSTAKKQAPAKAVAKPLAKPTSPAKPLSSAKPAISKPGSTAKAPAKNTAKSKSKAAAPRSYAQMQPTQERYKEIQQALLEKGYFRGTVDGAWGADSADAMKRFQTAQNLDADGKISALSLIALGLGPRRGNAAKAEDATKPAETAETSPASEATGGANPPIAPQQ